MARFPTILLAVLCATSCTTLDPLELPDSLPTQWTGPIPPVDPGLAADWWTAFSSNELIDIVGAVRVANLGLDTNRRNLRLAELNLAESRVDNLPIPTISVSATSRYDVLDPPNGDGIDGLTDSAAILGSVRYNDVLSKPARWLAARATFESARATAADITTRTLATAASIYFRLLWSRDQIATAELNLESAETIARIVQARADQGMITPIDALQQQIAVEARRNQLRSFRQTEFATRSTLALLLARTVQDFDVLGAGLEAIDVPTIAPDTPADLLRRRPDLIDAQANVLFAGAALEIADLAWLPILSINAGIDQRASSLGSLFNTATAADIVAGAAQTLIDDGARARSIEAARLRLENSLAVYREIAIAAFNEIEVALRNIELLKAQAAVAASDREAAEEAFRIATVRYREGVTDYQTLLIAQNSLFAARNGVLDNKLARLDAVVDFYQSLGGEWRDMGAGQDG